MEKIDYSKSIQSVFVICIALVLLGIFKQIPWLNYLCLTLGVSALASKNIADKIHWVWMKLAWILSLIFPPILLGIIFYLFLTPLAWLSKIFSKEDHLKLKRNYESTFIEREKAFEKVDFEKMW